MTVKTWKISEELWQRVEPLLPKRTRSKRRKYKRRPGGNGKRCEHLCADKRYTGKPAQKAAEQRRYISHIKQRGEDKTRTRKGTKHPARRWVVERTHSWLNHFRKLTVRYEKTKRSYGGLLELAYALITFSQVICIYG